MRTLAGVLITVMLACAAAPAAGAPDASAAGAFVTDGWVSALAHSGDTIYLGGTFTQVGPRTGPGVALSTGGAGRSLAAAPQVAGSSAEVHAAIGDGAGGWFIGGSFTHVAGVPRHNIAHVLAAGVVDAAWDSGASAIVRVLVLSSDGTALYAGGDFTAIGSKPRNRIAKLATSDTGAADPAWNPNANDTVSTLALSTPQPDVQWQVSTDGGATFANVPGQTLSTLSIPSTTTAQDGTRYRAVATSIAGRAITDTATLTVTVTTPSPTSGVADTTTRRPLITRAQRPGSNRDFSRCMGGGRHLRSANTSVNCRWEAPHDRNN